MGNGTGESYLRAYLNDQLKSLALEQGLTEQEANSFASQNAWGWNETGNLIEKSKANLKSFFEKRNEFVQSWVKKAEEKGLSHEEAVEFAKPYASYANDTSIDENEKYNRIASSLGAIVYDKQQKAYEEEQRKQQKAYEEEQRKQQEAYEAEQRRIEALTLELTKLAQDAGLDESKAQEFAQQHLNTPKEQLQSLLDQIVKLEQKKTELVNLAKNAGLDDERAHKFSEQNLDTEKEKLQVALESAVLQRQADQIKGFTSSQYPENQISISNSSRASSTINRLTNETASKTMIYNQKYSATIGNYDGSVSYNNETGRIFDDSRKISIETKGIKTEANAIPQKGYAFYSGYAFNGTQKTWDNDAPINGYLSYHVHFDRRAGNGSIDYTGSDSITLDEGTISGTSISSTAKQGYKSGSYSLDFFGKNAEEIGGKVSFDGKDVVGFGGTRGEIQK